MDSAGQIAERDSGGCVDQSIEHPAGQSLERRPAAADAIADRVVGSGGQTVQNRGDGVGIDLRIGREGHDPLAVRDRESGADRRHLALR